MNMFPLPGLPPDQLAIHLQCFHPNGHWIPFTDDEIQQSIPSRFEAIVNQFPDCIAVKSLENELTYAELNTVANRVAHLLLNLAGSKTEPIVICCRHDVSAIVAMLGVLKAGKFYTYIDPNAERSQNEYVISSINPSVMLVDTESHPTVQNLVTTYVRVINIETADYEDTHSDNPKLNIAPTAYAYITFTSGSTSQPKGVIEDHQDVLSFTARFTNYFHHCADDRLILVHRMNFGAAGVKIYPALLVGAGLCLYDLGKYGIPRLAQWIAEEEITTFAITVTLYRELVKYLPAKKNLSNLRLIAIGGEPIRPYDIEIYRNILPNHTLMRIAFGSTEAHFCTCYFFNKQSQFDTDEVPLGYPVGGGEILVVDEQGHELLQGEIGEIVVRRKYLTQGYWDNPVATDSRYRVDPEKPGMRMYFMGDLGYKRPDGCLVHKGRKDSQVKLKGQFIDLHDLEYILEQHDEVELAFAEIRDNSTASPKLVTYVKLQLNSEASVSTLYRYLINRAPRLLVPNAICIIDSLPMTKSGKLDTTLLPEPIFNRPDINTLYLPPETLLQSRLIALWQEVLHIELIGINDNFLELGADSLRAMMFLNRLQELLGEYVYIQSLFEAPTVALFSEYLKQYYPDKVKKLDHNLASEVNEHVSSSIHFFTHNRKLDADTIEEVQKWYAYFVRSPNKKEENQASEQNHPAVFILSTLRSGSTLCRVMLGGHPRLFAPPEMSLLYFNTLRERRELLSQEHTGERHGTIRAIMAARHCDVETAKNIMETFEQKNTSVQEFYNLMQNWIHPRVLVDKTPGYAYNIQTLTKAEKLFESPRYLYLVRHPCGMINSYVSARFLERLIITLRHSNPNLLLPDFTNNTQFTPEIVAEAIWLITQRNIQTFLKTVPVERQYLLRFEELVREPEQKMQEVSRFLEVDFHPGMLHPYADSSERMTDGIHALSRMIGDVKFLEHKGINPEVADQWRVKYSESMLCEQSKAIAERIGYF